MTGRLRIAFPYLLFAFMALLVLGSNVGGRATQRDARPAIPPPAMAAVTGLCPVCFMDAAEEEAFTVKADAVTLRFCSEGCRRRYLAAISESYARGNGRGLIDPVCNMEVNAAWGITHIHEGQTYHFCTEQCRRAFGSQPAAYVGDRCPVCDRPVAGQTALPATYLGHTYLLCSSEHRSEFKEDPASFFMHRMWGIPPWLYYVSIAAVLLISFAMFEGLPLFNRRGRSRAPHGKRPDVHGDRAVAADRLDLTRSRTLRRLLRSRPMRFSAQFAMVTAFALILLAGLFGDQNPALNVAPLLTWTIWWCGLVVLILFAGKAWCYFCPWDAIAAWMEKLRLWKKTEAGLGLGLPWPRAIRNIWVATVLFVGLTWIELGFGVTMRPRATAYLGLGMLVLAVVSAFLFERKSFCRYGCLVGRVSGLYAMFSGIEVRNRESDVCRACRGKECVAGSDRAYGCPTFENPSKMTVNTYCIQCTECLQACPHDNLAVNLRPWGSDLAVEGRPASDEAYLALLMLAITGFHGLTMTPAWPALLGWL
ncbi:MAG: YHS domain-containing protein, partial [Planctomycetota bacterium]